MVYREETSTFEELLERDGSVTIHQRNLQFLAIEMFKVEKGLAPIFMNEIFPKNKNKGAENVSSNTRANAIFYHSSNPKTVNRANYKVKIVASQNDRPNLISAGQFLAGQYYSLHTQHNNVSPRTPNSAACHTHARAHTRTL